MTSEQNIVSKLCEKFDFLNEENTIIQREKRIITKPLSKQDFEKVIKFAHDEMGFSRATHVVGVDDGDDLGFIYLITNDDNIIFAIKEKVPKSEPKINTMSALYPSLVIHERELIDLFGAEIEGMPPGPNYPLPDGWPEGNYPMRKEWNPDYFDRETMTYNPPENTKNKE